MQFTLVFDKYEECKTMTWKLIGGIMLELSSSMGPVIFCSSRLTPEIALCFEEGE